MKSIKLIEKEEQAGVEVVIREKISCEFCNEENKKGFKTEGDIGYGSICFDCVKGLNDILRSPAE